MRNLLFGLVAVTSLGMWSPANAGEAHLGDGTYSVYAEGNDRRSTCLKAIGRLARKKSEGYEARLLGENCRCKKKLSFWHCVAGYYRTQIDDSYPSPQSTIQSGLWYDCYGNQVFVEYL